MQVKKQLKMSQDIDLPWLVFLIASEGTLAMITEITLKLIPKPKFMQTYMGIFPDVNKDVNAVFKSLAAGANPVAMEFLRCPSY